MIHRALAVHHCGSSRAFYLGLYILQLHIVHRLTTQVTPYSRHRVYQKITTGQRCLRHSIPMTRLWLPPSPSPSAGPSPPVECARQLGSRHSAADGQTKFQVSTVVCWRIFEFLRPEFCLEFRFGREFWKL
jgi:hypothetical protein